MGVSISEWRHEPLAAHYHYSETHLHRTIAWPCHAMRPGPRSWRTCPLTRDKTMRYSRCLKRLTGAIEVPPSSHIIHDPLDREQDTLALLTVERREGLGGVGLVEERGWVGLGHPCVAVLELVGDGLRNRVGGEEDSLDGVEDVEEESGVHRGTEVESHGEYVLESSEEELERVQ